MCKSYSKGKIGKNQNISRIISFLKVEESLQMFNDVTNNVIIPAAGAKSSENLKLEIIRTLEQLNYQGNCLKLPHRHRKCFSPAE